MTSYSLSTPNKLLAEHPDAVAAACCAVLVLLGWLCLNFSWLGLALLLLVAAYIIGGYSSAKEGLTTLFAEKELDVDLLMIVAALGAAGLGLWQREYYFIVDGAVLILIFAISGALEGYAMQRTQRAIASLMSLTPDTARVILEGEEQEFTISQLKIGWRLLVKPGELIPVDSIIVEGVSNVNEASITGEPLPVEKNVGDEVFAGTINGAGALILRVHQAPESSLIGRIINLVKQAQTEEPPSQLFIEKFERGYAKAIVVCGILLAFVPSLFFHWNWQTTIYRALIFLVVASPCALMAAIMPVLLSGIANGARQGILFKSGAQLEMIGQTKAIAFDKTGTLTAGTPKIVEIIPAINQFKDTVLLVASAVEAYSEHPIGKAIVQYATGKFDIPSASKVQSHSGFGISGEVEGKQVLLGKATFVQQHISNVPENLPDNLIVESDRLEAQGKTVVWVALQGEVLGIIAVADTIRPEAAATVNRLQQLGIKVIMLTGDNQKTAENVAHQLGINQVYAGLLPEDKVSVIRQLQQKYKSVAMVGDGINDAPALATASVGIAMGIAGSDVALETADIVLMTDRLEKLLIAIHLGRRATSVVKQNIVLALSSITVLLIANFAAQITLPLGVVGHEGSTVLVTLSGLRLLKN